jgi:hypothetical protein
MELQSPLTQQQRPEYLEPKIVTLYRDLFRVLIARPTRSEQFVDVVQDVEGHEHTEGFWRELFLLKPDLAELKQILDDIDPEFLLHAPVCVLSTSSMPCSDMHVASISPAAPASDSRRERWQRTIR